MAPSLLKLITILSIFVLLTLHTQKTLSSNIQEDEEYVLDTPLPNLRSRSRFLATVIKEGTDCNHIARNICNGVSANSGTSLLQCCKTHCRNVLGDENNCGQCGNKCRFGELCCNGSCVNVAYNAYHCGKCNNKCAPGTPCNYGSCGYA
ncbi:hypothetical protein P3X46_006846 [Hevea brasiliensis]|uniref:Uncharacterized protein n=1 Tax=Hevea brasiliensis TaxID=3981 RepID=A0ABQ9MSK7_HEVBR|nr:protein GRIM REAPER-like [Hevea brasiliensis]KAJ9182913.1 hypothetical protein P3X46_006846 [Hevea brasiliensis]